MKLCRTFQSKRTEREPSRRLQWRCAVDTYFVFVLRHCPSTPYAIKSIPDGAVNALLLVAFTIWFHIPRLVALLGWHWPFAGWPTNIASPGWDILGELSHDEIQVLLLDQPGREGWHRQPQNTKWRKLLTRCLFLPYRKLCDNCWDNS